MAFNPKDNDQHFVSPVRQIINRFFPEDTRLSLAREPRHLEMLGNELGVRKVLTRPMSGNQDQHPGIDAMLIPLPEGYSVVINELAPGTRQNFSLAHELAHIMVLEAESSDQGLPKQTRYRSSASATAKWKAEERLCDAIAAELLMPEQLFTREISKFGRSLEHLPRLAKLFGASLTATAIRYSEVIPEPCHLIWWKPAGRTKELIRPIRQQRNKFPGLSICPITASSIVKRDEFRTLRETWKTMRMLDSQEKLLAKKTNNRMRQIHSVTFETESLGFGNADYRTIMSTVYLDRVCENA